MNEIDRSRPLVVILDDEPGIIRYCGRVLERAGYTTLAFTDPYEALGVLEQREEAGLLLADIRMPEMDGFQVIEQARLRHPDLTVVVMTGYASVEVAIEALQRGADGLLLKPFGGSQLVQGVQHALEKRQHKQDQMRLQALRPLFDISETLFSETNLKRLQELILNAVCGHLRCSHAEYYQASKGDGIFDAEKSGRMRLVGGLHYPGGKARVERRPASSLSNEPIVRRASQLGTVLSIQVDGPGDAELKEMLKQRKLGCVLCAPVPVNTGGGMASSMLASSMLVAGRDEDEPRFGEADRELLAILARQAAVALENARLIEERQAYIRQLEQSQRALIQAEKMAIAGRLTASIAHEINNPLQAVQNCVHLAGRGELPTAERQNYLELAGGELDRLMATVQRMLDFYRPVRLDRKPVEINQLVRNLMRLLDKQLADEQVSVKTNLALNLPAVMAVGDQIQQVLLNLMLNAMEAMKDSAAGDAAAGEASRRLEIQTGINPSNGKEIEILIEDNGPGISALQRKQLFEPFASNKEGGMGLGLAVSYGIITAHGGSLDLVERGGGSKQGACFRITLPIDKEQGS